MKRPILLFAAIGLLAFAWVVRADTLRFPVTLRQGKAESDEGEFGITRGKIVGEDHLILVIDRDFHEIRLEQVDDDTNSVADILISTFAAILSNGEFAAVCEFTDWELPNLDLNSGAALLKGQFRESSNSVTLTKARLNGVLNDSVSGGDSNGVDRIFQIVIKATGPSLDFEGFDPDL